MEGACKVHVDAAAAAASINYNASHMHSAPPNPLGRFCERKKERTPDGGRQREADRVR